MRVGVDLIDTSEVRRLNQKMLGKILPEQKFGRWTVLDDITLTHKGERKYLCLCECGTMRYVLERSLLYGGSKSCGCLQKESAAAAVSPDLTGQTFGELTVLRRAENPKARGAVWVCQCSCGAEYEVQGTLLTNGRRTRCSSNVHQKNYAFSDIAGQKFEMLTALYPLRDRKGSRSVMWRCRCDCGKEIDVAYNNLVYCNMKSCGCRKKAHDQKLGSFLTHVDGTSMEMIKSKKVPADNTTGYRGVYLIKGKYVAKIVFQKKAYYLGTYDSIEQAAEARKNAEELLYDQVSAFYDMWKQRAAEDPAWAERNPVSIQVTKNRESGISVALLPKME